MMYASRAGAGRDQPAGHRGASRTRCSTSRRKALGVPVYELFGGPVRERLPVYWSHCGSYRVPTRELVGVPPLRT